MSEDRVKQIVNLVGQYQKTEDATCPRCGKVMKGKTSAQALSRYANVMICSDCGTEEALADFGLIDKLPLTQWKVVAEIDACEV